MFITHLQTWLTMVIPAFICLTKSHTNARKYQIYGRKAYTHIVFKMFRVHRFVSYHAQPNKVYATAPKLSTCCLEMPHLKLTFCKAHWLIN